MAGVLGGLAALRQRLARAWPKLVAARRHWHHPGVRRLRAGTAMLFVTLAGAAFGILLLGHVQQEVGPFQAEFSLQPSVSGGTEVRLPPLGALAVRSHAGPAHLVIDLQALDDARTRQLISEPDGITRASDRAVGDITTGLKRLGLQVAAVALLGAMGLAALIFRSVRRVATCGLLALGVLVVSTGIAAGTFSRTSLAEPKYTGLLTNARAVVGDAQRIADRYDAYRDQLQKMVANVSRIYATIATLPVYEQGDGSIKVLHISDMHLNPAGWSVVQTVVDQFDIDLVVDTGDITDWGSEPEASFVESIGRLRVPYVFVRGNHDSLLTQAAVERQSNAIVLDNRVVTVSGLTIAGIGDPRFTPDKSAEPTEPAAAGEVQDELARTGERLAATVRASAVPVNIALIHDPAAAGPLAGVVPLVLAGHLHHRETLELPAPTASDAPPATVKQTTVRVEGSTGGAGLRGLESGEALPLELSVLYFGSAHTLQAYDQIDVGGAGQTEVTLERHVVTPAEEPAPLSTPR